MLKHHFREGESVYHKENLEQTITVSRILKESIEINSGLDKETNTPIKKRVNRMIGIECHWWQKTDNSREKVLMKQKFHSSELVPIEIGSKGKEAVIEWLSK
jgi:hypothetical protein